MAIFTAVVGWLGLAAVYGYGGTATLACAVARVHNHTGMLCPPPNLAVYRCAGIDSSCVEIVVHLYS